jgi:hypothetical protein
MKNAYQNELVNRMKSMNQRPIKGVVFATWLYSLFFLIYLSFRLIFNAAHVQLDDLFIDHVPFFTFLTTGVVLLVINLTSLGLYLAIRRTYKRRNVPIGMKEPTRSFPFIWRKTIPTPDRDVFDDHQGSLVPGNFPVKTLIIWTFSISIWIYLSYLSLAHPPSPPYWPISMWMFIISYICMVYMITARDSRVAIRSL